MTRTLERPRKDAGRIGITVDAKFEDWLDKKAIATGKSRCGVVADLIAAAMKIDPDPDPFPRRFATAR